MYINNKEISEILGYKSLKSYQNSKKSKEAIEKLIDVITKRIESKYENKLSLYKQELITYINSI